MTEGKKNSAVIGVLKGKGRRMDEGVSRVQEGLQRGGGTERRDYEEKNSATR